MACRGPDEQPWASPSPWCGRWLARFGQTLIAGNERIDFEGGTEGLDGKLGALPGVASVNPLPEGGSRVELEGDAAARGVLKVLVDDGVTTISMSRPSLEEIYIRVIGDKAAGSADRNDT